MRNRSIEKAVAFAVATIFILVATSPAIGSIIKSGTSNTITIGYGDKPVLGTFSNNQPELSSEEYALKQKEVYREVSLDKGWYWKPPYPNYAPHEPGGMPDFDQRQDAWKTIEPGENGVIDSTPVGDDFYNPSENRIVPGPNCHLETDPIGDDYTAWAFCGPVAVANCFWWFDSKYADENGTPGDGEDNFSLVEDYGVGDDHLSANVPLLIETLAKAMDTCNKGTTYIDDMQDAIDDWFIDTGLGDKFEETTYDRPTFDFIEGEIERSQDVILLLGYYDRVKIVDQEQTLWNAYVDLPTWLPGHLQGFTPSVDVLDAVQVLLAANYPGIPTDVEVCIWDTLPNSTTNPLGCSLMNITPPPLGEPEWFQFHFDSSIPLTPGEEYFISVKELTMTYNIHWYYHEPDIYPNGMAWWATADWAFAPQLDKDFAFKTEYYTDECIRKGGHYVTCAGVNSEESMIAFSDPFWDIQNQSQDPTEHNDAQYVSHDIYEVENGSPCPDLDYQWWLPDYPSYSQYTIVEQAVVICPLEEDVDPPIKEITKPINAIYLFDRFIMPFLFPLIIGPITIEVDATDNQSGMNRVEFYIDDELRHNDTTEPYSWKWIESTFRIHMIKVIAYDNAENFATNRIGVLKFF